MGDEAAHFVRLAQQLMAGRIPPQHPGGLERSRTEVQSWASSWVSCGSRNVPNAWKNLPFTNDLPTISASDYGRVNISSCVPSGVQTVGSSAGTSQSGLRNSWLSDEGYPVRYTCPVGSLGGTTDCPTMGSQGVIQTRPNNGGVPHTGADLFADGTVSNSTLTLDSVPSGTSIGFPQIDATRGQSGSALMRLDAPTGILYVVGTLSTNSSTVTRYNHLTVAIRDWVLQ
jgi:hypothetical protein